MGVPLLVIAAAALAVIIGAGFAGYFLYRLRKDAWIRYLLYYILVLFMQLSSRGITAYIGGHGPVAAVSLAATLELVYLLVSAFGLYIFPVLVFLCFRGVSSLKEKMLLLVLPGFVLIADLIGVIWEIVPMQQAVSAVEYGYLLFFAGLGLVRLVKTDLGVGIPASLRVPVLLLMVLSAGFYSGSFCTALIELPLPINADLTRVWAYLFASYVFLFGILVVAAVCRFRRADRKGGDGNRRRLMEKYELGSFDAIIVESLEQGMGNREIAGVLDIPQREVDARVYEIYMKFGVKNRRELLDILKSSE